MQLQQYFITKVMQPRTIRISRAQSTRSSMKRSIFIIILVPLNFMSTLETSEPACLADAMSNWSSPSVFSTYQILSSPQVWTSSRNISFEPVKSRRGTTIQSYSSSLPTISKFTIFSKLAWIVSTFDGVFIAKVGSAEISYMVLNMFHKQVIVPVSTKLSKTVNMN